MTHEHCIRASCRHVSGVQSQVLTPISPSKATRSHQVGIATIAVFTLVKSLLLIEVGIRLAGMDGLAALEFRLSVWWLGWACFL
ncbi:MAG: hypothetical protein HP496_09010 [Nitrospira sp.]|nr:hypothetical protein [Nitrospira sp.]